MVKRILYAIPALALFFSVLYLHGLYAQLVIAAAALLCAHEMMRALKSVSRPVFALGYLYTVLLYPAYAFAGGFCGVAVLLVLGVMLAVCVPMLSGRDAAGSMVTALTMIYPGLFAAFLLALAITPEPEMSRFLLIIAFGAAVVTDTFAYMIGRLFGKHKLLPAVSPKKTVEGAIGGLVFGTAVVWALGFGLQNLFGVGIEPLWYLALGFALSILSQLGDLAASFIKRRLGIKDFGSFMGEHGGALDRLDSVLFISPAVFGFYLLIGI